MYSILLFQTKCTSRFPIILIDWLSFQLAQWKRESIWKYKSINIIYFGINMRYIVPTKQNFKLFFNKNENNFINFITFHAFLYKLWFIKHNNYIANLRMTIIIITNIIKILVMLTFY